MCEDLSGPLKLRRSHLRRRGPGAAVPLVSFLLLAVPLQAGEANAGASDLEVSSGSQSGGCVESDTVMCLQDGRYEATIEWMTAAGESGQAKVARPRTTDSGLFYFYDRNNWEVLLKVLEGCDINGHHWVYAASASDIGMTLVVRDTTLPDTRDDGTMNVNSRTYTFAPHTRRARMPGESEEDYQANVLAKGHPALTASSAFPDACGS